LLEALAHDPQGLEMQDWLSHTAHLLGNISVLLLSFQHNLQNRMDDNVVIPEPVALLHTGRPGCPKKLIDVEFLTEAVSTSRQIKLTELSEMLGVHRNTLRRYMKCYGVERKYSNLTNVDLDCLVTEFKKERPD
ncbi:hypothetical protein CY34DRAFT_39812, partial [Suillus luteus UH-Slu-Lm8-n1]